MFCASHSTLLRLIILDVILGVLLLIGAVFASSDWLAPAPASDDSALAHPVIAPETPRVSSANTPEPIAPPAAGIANPPTTEPSAPLPIPATVPPPNQPPSLPATPESTARLLFTGDVMLGRNITSIRRKFGNGYPFAAVAPVIRGADLAFCNLESPLTSQTYFRGGYNLRAEPAAVESLALAGFDWVAVANNHSGDHGRAGLADTLNALRSKNIAWAGGGYTEAEARKPALKTVGDVRLALLAYDGTRATIRASGNQPGSQWLDLNAATADIRNARLQADVVIVSVHWGVEYANLPTAAQKQSARQLAQAGADLIIGHHPHVVEPLEWITRADGRASVVAYSLGNFIFDQWFETRVMEGVILQVIVDKKGVAALNLTPTRNSGGQAQALSAPAGAVVLRRLLPPGALPETWARSARADAAGRTWWHRPSP